MTLYRSYLWILGASLGLAVLISLTLPRLRPWLMAEDHLVEYLTVACFFGTFLVCLSFLLRRARNGGRKYLLPLGFLGLLSRHANTEAGEEQGQRRVHLQVLFDHQKCWGIE